MGLSAYIQVMLGFDSMDKLLIMCAFIHLLQIIIVIMSATGIEICSHAYRTYDKNGTYIVYFFLWLFIMPFLGYSMHNTVITYDNKNQIDAVLTITSNIFNMVYITIITYFDIGHRVYETIDYSCCQSKNNRQQNYRET